MCNCVCMWDFYKKIIYIFVLNEIIKKKGQKYDYSKIIEFPFSVLFIYIQ